MFPLSTPGPLGIYLNDHLAGATAGTALAARAARAQAGTPAGRTLSRLAGEIATDRDALLEMMKQLGVPVRDYKVLAGWIGEKAGRLKPNGYLVSRSPLSSVVELEGLVLGVTGKLSMWRALRAVAVRDPRLDEALLDDLATRARRQIEELERMRMAAAKDTFAG
jgi:hypothetical protein